MTKDQFKHILKNASLSEKWIIIKEADASLLDNELFDLFVFQLEDADDSVRFFALFQLIDIFSEKLSKPTDELANLMIKLLSNETGPVIDRAVWAISIMGEVGLDKLFQKVTTNDLRLRSLVIGAIGRNTNLNLKKEKAIEILLDGVQDENDGVRFSSMCAIMHISPYRDHNNNRIKNYDFSAIYKIVKPVAKSFMESDEKNHTDFAERYYKWIQKEQQKTP